MKIFWNRPWGPEMFIAVFGEKYIDIYRYLLISESELNCVFGQDRQKVKVRLS